MEGAKQCPNPTSAAVKFSQNEGKSFEDITLYRNSQKQHVVARSSTESEFRALAYAAAELMWIQSLLQELHVSVLHSPIIWVDNQSATALAPNLVFHARSKHIEIDLHFVRDQIVTKKLAVQPVDVRKERRIGGLLMHKGKRTLVLRTGECVGRTGRAWRAGARGEWVRCSGMGFSKR
uniref:Uncharacterized protein n=1 Tax=Cannabis sativa TaxID=3483 RepID=A0A803Q2C8_CANSA